MDQLEQEEDVDLLEHEEDLDQDSANRCGKPIPIAVGHATAITHTKQLWVGTENGFMGSSMSSNILTSSLTITFICKMPCSHREKNISNVVAEYKKNNQIPYKN